MSLKAHRFLIANESSPVEYCSVERHQCTYRLADGSMWSFSRREAAELGPPRWAQFA